jgi:hypothetical protein
MSNKVDVDLVLSDSINSAALVGIKAGQTVQAVRQDGDPPAWLCLTEDGLELGTFPQNIARRLERASNVTCTIRSLKRKPGIPAEVASILVRAVFGKGPSAAGIPFSSAQFRCTFQ